ncbi:DNA-binding transcriptional regulator, LysR family [Sporobacter termitidis DSM 10068]|uniref:DNA-binding transcriptional regulator, LysR family n=1 Tax=Sporobacter termitidis DSM 10068 TaxID=1123282 RepID=A0A1M5XHU5_9FIRM|nr:LysR family transcriptional regulator [Sporobacter termitidis]SHH99202.1 DNA-binding transcriptional regulator, LysR family [Sporobacter termitidis DSM 10068]
MDLFSLNCFVTLAECSKFYEAAETLHLSQSSLSRHIRLVEQELGVKLFIRHSYGSELTPAGTGLLPYAENIIREYENTRHLLEEYRESRENRQVAYTHSFLSHYHLTDMVFDFQKTYPGVQLELQEFDSQSALHRFRDDPGSVCIVFSERETKLESYDQHALMSDDLVLLVSRRHQLAGKDAARLSMLRDERYLIVLKEPFLHAFILKQFRKAGLSPKVKPYVLWYSTISKVVVRQNFVSVLPRKIAEHIYSPDMKILELKDADPFSVQLIKDKKNTADISSLFFDFAKNYTLS